MKKQSYYSLILFCGLSLLLLVSCEGIPGIIPKSKYFVKSYLQVNSPLKLYTQDYYPNIFLMNFGDETEIYEGTEAFQELAERYGDTHYNRPLTPGSNPCLANEFTSIEITSNADFNAHPAGTSLAGISRIIAISPYKYTTSGYKSVFCWGKDMPADYKRGGAINLATGISEGFHPVNKLLSDLKPEDLKMLSLQSCAFCFAEQPEIKEHTFTVTFYEGERAFKGSVEMVFTE